MDYIPEEIILLISSFLNNRDSLHIVKTCKYYKNILYKYGFYKSLNYNSNFIHFLENFKKHNNTLTDVYIHNASNIHILMFMMWPKRISFLNCIFTYDIKPNNTNTEYLYITSLKNTKIKIDWSKFPKIKCLFLNIHDIDLNGIELCSNLEIICLYLEINNTTNGSHTIIPKTIESLQNLTHIISNCNLSLNTNFVSQKLKTCISANYNANNITYNSPYNIIKNRNYYPEKNIEQLYNRLIKNI